MAKPVPKIPIIVDTREQVGHCFEFDCEMFTTQRTTVKTGDYTIVGFEDILTIERKTLGDAVGTFFAGWTKFRRELNRLSAMDFPLIVVECDLADIFEHRYESDAEPASVLGKMNSILIDHAVPIVCWGKRSTANVMVERYLIQLVKKLGGLPL